MITPELRFKEFNSDWEVTRLGKRATFTKGKGISKADINEKGQHPCIRYGELYTHYGTVIDEVISFTNCDVNSLVLSEGDEVLIPASGETALDIATASVIRLIGVVLGSDLNIIKSNIDGAFLANYLSGKKKIQIARLAQGISVIHIYSSQLKLLEIAIPTLEEQRKIAEFLGAVDAKLDALRRKKALLAEYKRGVMQKLFSQEIRFVGDDGRPFPEWKINPIGQLGETINGLTGKTAEDFGQGTRFVTYKQVFDRSFIDLRKCEFVNILPDERQNQLKRGDVLFTTSSETPGEVGFASVLLHEPGELYLNSFCFALRPNSIKTLLPEFSRYLFRSPIYRRKVFMLAQGSTRFNLSKSSFKKLTLPVPCVGEQQKIANFLTTIDEIITAVDQQSEQVEAFKKGLLQQMFV